MASSSEAWSSGFSVWVGGPGLGWAGSWAAAGLGAGRGAGLGWARSSGFETCPDLKNKVSRWPTATSNFYLFLSCGFRV